MSTWMVYATVVTLLMGGAAWVLERATHDLRVPTRWIWAGALVVSCVLPLGALLVLAQPTAVLPVDAPAAMQLGAPSLVDESAPAPAAPAARTFRIPDAALPTIPSLPARLDPLVRIGWSALSLALLFGLVRAFQTVRRARMGWAVEHVHGRDVLVSEAIGPAVVGVLRPDIVMPRWALELSPRDRELMLRHEDEHRRAGDAPLLMAAVLLSVLLPWNLPIWWQLRRLRLAVEIDCDRRVLRGSRDLRRYAALLLEIGRRRTSPVMSLALAEPASFLERRIRTMTHRPQPRFVRIVSLVLASAALVVAAGRMDRPAVQLASAEEPALVLGERVTASPAAVSKTLENESPEPSGPEIVTGEVVVSSFNPSGGDDKPLVVETPAPVVSTIRGTVTDARTSQPIADANVYVVGTNLASNTNNAGAYALLNVPAGTHELRVERLGYTTASRVVAISDGVVLETSFALASELPIERPAAAPGPAVGRLRGVVTDANDTPIANVQVYLVGASLGALTRQNGTFLIINVPPGTYTARAERIGMESVSREITIVAQAELQQNFQLQGSLAASDSALARMQEIVNPETGTRIRLRGTQIPPLIYIDGVRISPPPGDDMSSLVKPEEIDRIEVIRGEAAARIYGPEAVSGVILIFKKRPGPGGQASALWPMSASDFLYLRSLGLELPG